MVQDVDGSSSTTSVSWLSWLGDIDRGEWCRGGGGNASPVATGWDTVGWNTVAGESGVDDRVLRSLVDLSIKSLDGLVRGLGGDGGGEPVCRC